MLYRIIRNRWALDAQLEQNNKFCKAVKLIQTRMKSKNLLDELELQNFNITSRQNILLLKLLRCNMYSYSSIYIHLTELAIDQNNLTYNQESFTTLAPPPPLPNIISAKFIKQKNIWYFSCKTKPALGLSPCLISYEDFKSTFTTLSKATLYDVPYLTEQDLCQASPSFRSALGAYTRHINSQYFLRPKPHN